MLKSKKLLALGVGAGVIAALKGVRYFVETDDKGLDSSLSNSNKDLLTLKGGDLVNYPWSPRFDLKKQPEDWELRKVKVRGILYKHFHLVSRERKGEPGYLVFQGLKTANGLDPTSFIDGVEAPPVGLMVKVGWISAKNVRDLQNQEVNFITKVEPDTSLPAGLFSQVINPATGFVYNTEGEDLEYPIEGMDVQEVEVTGFLRKGETQNWLQGRRRFYVEKTTTFIDLERMAAFYHFANVWPATHYYLEAAVEDPEGNVEKENKIIPANLDKPLVTFKDETDMETKKTLRTLERFTGAATVLGVLLA